MAKSATDRLVLMEALLKAGHTVEPRSEMHCWAMAVEGKEAARRAMAREDLFNTGVWVVCFWRRGLVVVLG